MRTPPHRQSASTEASGIIASLRVRIVGAAEKFDTAQACLTNDVKGKVAKRLTDVSDRERLRCLSAPEQRATIGYTNAFTVGSGATAASRGVVADIFGSDLDAAIVSDDVDGTGAKC